jgi:KaiC/GvpD/RAD55 family RecA-like ATPase
MEQNAGVLEVTEQIPSVKSPPKIKFKEIIPQTEPINSEEPLPDLDSSKEEEKVNDLPDLVEEKVEEVKVEKPIETTEPLYEPKIEVPNTEINENPATSPVEVTETSIIENPITSQPEITESNNIETPIEVETASEQTTTIENTQSTPIEEPQAEQVQEPVTPEIIEDPILSEETKIQEQINKLENPELENESNIQPSVQEENQFETKVFVDSVTKKELEEINNQQQNIDQPVKKKRGRKPKIRIDSAEPSIQESTPITSSQTTPIDTVNIAQEPVVESAPIVTEQPEIKVKKKRGRKPKVKVDATTLTTTSEQVIQNTAMEVNPIITVTDNLASTNVATESINITEIPVQDSSIPITSTIQSPINESIQEDNITEKPTVSSDIDLISRTPTGIPGFDELVEGGFPKSSSTLICGGPGCGKTIFCMQYLINGATQFNEKGLYVTFEQRASDLRRQAKQFGWDIEDLEYKGMIHIISLPVEKITMKTIQEIQKIVKRDNIKRLVIDSLSTLIINAPIYTSPSELAVQDVVGENIVFSPPIIGDYIVKRFVYGFIEQLRSFNTTNLLISEASQSGEYITRDSLSEFVCDGVVLISFESLGGEFSRSLIVRKMRATKNDEDIHPLEIGKKGIVVHEVTK